MLTRNQSQLRLSADGISDISLVDASRFRVDISANGMVTWIPGGQWKTECQVNLVAFPFDEQRCQVIFTNWVHKTAILYNMRTPGYVRLDGYSPNSEWELLNASSAVMIRTYNADEENVFELPTASFMVELRRSSGYYVLNVLIPTLTLSLISVLMFWLPPECGERVSFGITILLSFSFIMLMMSDGSDGDGGYDDDNDRDDDDGDDDYDDDDEDDTTLLLLMMMMMMLMMMMMIYVPGLLPQFRIDEGFRERQKRWPNIRV
ncbi:hypothetical protein LSH36_331g01037 [Paralvinella palmiformis]|uniref:Neurotransmitter-gated ion-channel ligand-binding domain-containing protein n=1 Tax=Paralvinella palmiformis TaxID=53620 RepID=A0AAD9N2Y9_9ANNE|nr:hypothetical protein LSH36_331g01037 [Paralvinella palmiformis]